MEGECRSSEEEQTEDEDDDEDEEEMPPPPTLYTRQGVPGRNSISAEAFGDWNPRVHFQPPSFEKTPEQLAAIQECLANSIFFNQLEEEDMAIVIGAIKGPLEPLPGEKVITQGEDGDCLYVVEQGQLACVREDAGEERVVYVCGPGDIFGELALLYNTTRTASVVSQSNATIWELGRDTFQNIVMQSSAARRTNIVRFLRQVPVFRDVTEVEIGTIADSLKKERHHEGEVIIHQGAHGDKFYVVLSGQALATKEVSGAEPMMMLHSPGDYFGELALIHDEPRAATVVATSPQLELLVMDRATFKRLIGTAEELQNRAARYS